MVEAVTGIILCGGEGRRMGGVDKPLLEREGRPLVAQVHAALAPQVTQMLVSANRHAERYAAYGEVIADAHPGRGPLEGLASALARVDTPLAFVCPGDAPHLDTTLVARLAAALGNADAAYPHDGVQPQHLFLLLRTALLHDLQAWLDAGGRSVRRFLATRVVVEVNAHDIASSFLNVNEPRDLEM